MKLYTVIKGLREENGLTQDKLAEKAGLTRGYISRLEKGTYPDDSPSIKTLKKIADGLKIPLEFILNKAGITQDDYVELADAPTFLRAKYDLNKNQIQDVETYIEYIKKRLKK